MAGFLYAFYRYSKDPHASWMQYLVRLAVASDIIHVAVVPVLSYHGTTAAPLKLVLDNQAFTAYAGIGFDVRPADSILTPSYDLVLVPTPDPHDFEAGMRFLRSLRGANYNYATLPLTLLPPAWKRWFLPHDDGGGHLPHSYYHDQEEEEEEMHHRHEKIFCSQMALLLCYVSRTLRHDELPPSMCTPADLAALLRAQGGLPCSASDVVVSVIAHA